LQRTILGNLTSNPWRVIRGYVWFLRDLRNYRRLGGEAPLRDLSPRLYDKTDITPLDAYYFYQDTWLAGKVFNSKPPYHVDVGSTALLVGILSKFTQVCSVDIRPLPVSLPNLQVKRGSVLALPFEDSILLSLSSLCVIEHIGLGRYGDPIDPLGTEKAIAELCRVLAPGGNLYVSVPLEKSSRVQFNAHRVFCPDAFLNKFTGLDLIEVAFVQPDGIHNLDVLDANSTLSGLTVGLFHLQRPCLDKTDSQQQTEYR
jgi:SAM-dependent methyltransferase